MTSEYPYHLSTINPLPGDVDWTTLTDLQRLLLAEICFGMLPQKHVYTSDGFEELWAFGLVYLKTTTNFLTGKPTGVTRVTPAGGLMVKAHWSRTDFEAALEAYTKSDAS